MLASSFRGQILSSEMSSASAASPVQAVVRQLSDDPEAGISNLTMEPMTRPDPSSYPESSVIVRLDPELSLTIALRLNFSLSECRTAPCTGWTAS